MISDDVRSLYNRSKRALVIRGLLGIALGFFILSRPLESVAALALVVAIWALMDGIVTMVRAVELRSVAPHWWVMFLAGFVSAAFGVAALYYYPVLSLAFVVAWAALWLITAGVLAASVALQERRAHLPWGWTLTLGVITIVGGVLAYMYPGSTLASLISLLAAYGIVGGIVMLVGAAKMQSFQGDLSDALRGPANVPH